MAKGFQMRGSGVIPALVVLAFGSQASLASDWSALVVGQSDQASDSGLDDAVLARQGFGAAGIPVIDTIMNGSGDAVQDAVAGLAGQRGAVIYYSGPASTDGLALRDGAVGFDALMAAVARTGVTSLVLMIENCPSDGSDADLAAVLPPAPPGLEAMMFSSADAATTCTTEGRLTDRLATIAQGGPSPVDLGDALSGLPVSGAITGAISGGAGTVDVGDDIEFLPDDVILLDAVDGAPTAAPVEVVLPVVTEEDDATPTDWNEPLITLAVLPAEQIAALPLIAGQPEPSIIVGMMEGITDAAMWSDDAPQDDSRALAYDDVAAREALRANNPDLFDLLLTTGSFDPPEGQLAVALQTELQRMNCYTLRVDGDWGNGSRRAFQAYLDRLDGVQVASLDPSVDLFRLILRNDAVTCPAAAAAAPAAAGRAAAPAQTAPAQPTPPVAAQPAPAAPDSAAPGFRGNFGGVFR